MYDKYYVADNIQGEVRIDIQALSKAFLWAMASTDDSIREEQLGKVTEKFDEFESNLTKFSKVYSNSELLSKIRTDLDTVENNGKKLKELFDAGSSDKETFEYFNDVLYPSIDVVVGDFKKVSVEVSEESAKLNAMVTAVDIIFIIIAVIIIVLALGYIKIASRALTISIVTPVEEISKAAKKMSEGDLDIVVNYKSEDELGGLANDMARATTNMRDIVSDIGETLVRISGGDFTRGTDNAEIYIGDYINIKNAFDEITTTLSRTLNTVKEATTQVSEGAANMSQGAVALAEGATDQSATIEELTSAVEAVTTQTHKMAKSSNRGSEMAVTVQNNTKQGAIKMSEVTSNMSGLNEASKQIEQITNTIEAIATQTQLLSLNASIEAARAGEAGKGFAVVAEEISNLAGQSNEAAKNTHELIAKTLELIDNGNKVVDETVEALNQVQESVENIAQIIKESGELADKQVVSMDEITTGIEDISNVIQSNSATAEESSAVSTELSDQAERLESLMSQFELQ
ncbi:methyl-accepting chemotaxis protein [Lachnospiraceae bacterium C7]|nr:methyl-accepting chemotaxis protein [Lachnospiraceae bacterium C7]